MIGMNLFKGCWIFSLEVPKTDIMGQFLGTETDIMGKRYFMVELMAGPSAEAVEKEWLREIGSKRC